MTATIAPGSSDEGFIPRQTADIQHAINEDMALISDPRTGQFPFQNNSDDTIHQQVTAEYAEATAQVENAAAWAYQMRDPLTATGAALSALVQLNGILRNAGAYSVIPVTMNGTPGTLIPAGSLVGSVDGLYSFATSENVVLDSSGYGRTLATCTVYGVISPEPGTVVIIQTPVSGWLDVTNGPANSVGKEEETDEELRRRQQQSTNATSYRQIEAIRAAILDVPGVTFCRAYQNSDLATDERGIPGKTLACVVVGGDQKLICEAMFLRSPLGIRYIGNVTEIMYDGQQIAYPVSFTRPVERFIDVSVTLEIVNDEKIQIFPEDGIERVKNAIIEFADNGATVCEPYGNPGLPPGQDVIISQLYTPINSIGGTRIVQILLGVDEGAMSANDIVIAWNEIGIITADRIEVNII